MDTPESTTDDREALAARIAVPVPAEDGMVRLPVAVDPSRHPPIVSGDGVEHVPGWEIVRCCGGHPPLLICLGCTDPWPCEPAEHRATAFDGIRDQLGAYVMPDLVRREAAEVLAGIARRVRDPIAMTGPCPGLTGG